MQVSLIKQLLFFQLNTISATYWLLMKTLMGFWSLCSALLSYVSLLYQPHLDLIIRGLSMVWSLISQVLPRYFSLSQCLVIAVFILLHKVSNYFIQWCLSHHRIQHSIREQRIFVECCFSSPSPVDPTSPLPGLSKVSNTNIQARSRCHKNVCGVQT